jgi:hypothetical protein
VIDASVPGSIGTVESRVWSSSDCAHAKLKHKAAAVNAAPIVIRFKVVPPLPFAM